MGLEGMRVLVVEDEMLVAMALEDQLSARGAKVVGPAMRLESALQMAEHEAFDVAILDVNLHGGRSYPVARILRDRGVPFVFATGYGHTEDHEELADVVTLAKPYRIDDLAKALERVVRLTLPQGKTGPTAPA